MLAALFAVGVVVGFAAVRLPGTSSHTATAPTTTSPHGSAFPSQPPATLPPPTVAVPPSTTSPPAASPQTAAARGTTFTVPEPGPSGPPPVCTPDDLFVSTTTDRATYAAGNTVTVTTVLRAERRTCLFQPVAVAGYGCNVVTAVNGPSGSQVWPWPDESVRCAMAGPTVLSPGDGQELTDAWNGQVTDDGGRSFHAAAAGQYQAVGLWSWSAGPGKPPYTLAVASSTFTIS